MSLCCLLKKETFGYSLVLWQCPGLLTFTFKDVPVWLNNCDTWKGGGGGGGGGMLIGKMV